MADDKQGVVLKGVVSGIIQALQEAKYSGDMQSAKLKELYKSEKAFVGFSAPVFTIADVEIELRFAVAVPSFDSKDSAEVRVYISPDSLKGLQEHQVSTMKFKISAVNSPIFEENK